MLSKFPRYAVYILTILIANYLSEIFFEHLNQFKERNYLTVLLGMGIIVAVYVPLFGFLEKYLKKASKSYMSGSKSIAKNSKQGMLIGFGVGFLVLFYLYAKLWFKLDLVTDITSLF